MSRQASQMTVTPAAFHIMLVLARQPAHGYGIMQEVERISEGSMKLGPGTLYRSIQRMLVDELIEELDVQLDGEVDDERRRTYRLTSFGKRVAGAEAARLKRLVDEARNCGLVAMGKRRRPS